MSMSDTTKPQEAMMAYKNSPYRLRLRYMLVLLITVVVLEGVMVAHIYPDTDYLFHIQAAEAISKGVEVDFPHRLFHYITITIHAVIPWASFYAAGLLTALIAYSVLAAALAISFHRQLRGRRPWIAVGLALGLMLTAPILLLNPQGQGLYYGYLHPFTYHNPTSTLMRPLALIVFLYVACALLPPVATWGQIAAAAMVTILLSNAKPNYSLALLPVAGLLALYRLTRRLFIDLKILAVILGVIVFFLVIQYMATFNSGGASIGLAVRPLFLLHLRGFSLAAIVVKQALSVVFPLVVLGLYWPLARRDSMLMLAWGIFIVGAFYALCLVELGSRLTDNNFYWSGEITLFLLFFASVHFWLRQMGGRFDLSSRRAQLTLIFWGLHIVSGVYWYAAQLLTTPVYNAW